MAEGKKVPKGPGVLLIAPGLLLNTLGATQPRLGGYRFVLMALGLGLLVGSLVLSLMEARQRMEERRSALGEARP